MKLVVNSILALILASVILGYLSKKKEKQKKKRKIKEPQVKNVTKSDINLKNCYQFFTVVLNIS